MIASDLFPCPGALAFEFWVWLLPFEDLLVYQLIVLHVHGQVGDISLVDDLASVLLTCADKEAPQASLGGGLHEALVRAPHDRAQVGGRSRLPQGAVLVAPSCGPPVGGRGRLCFLLLMVAAGILVR